MRIVSRSAFVVTVGVIKYGVCTHLGMLHGKRKKKSEMEAGNEYCGVTVPYIEMTEFTNLS